MFDADGHLSLEQRAHFLGKCARRSYRKKEVVHAGGATVHGVWFVVHGLVGSFEWYKDRSIYQRFFLEHSCASDVASLRSGEPSRLTFVALETCELLYIKKVDMLGLYDQDPAYQAFGRAILTQLVVDRDEQMRRLMQMNPQERYQSLLSEEPALVQRVPLQYLASYLGMTRETLSRVRRK